MTVVFDTYVPGHSLLHQLDPRVKLWVAVVGVVLTFLLPSLSLQLTFLLVVHMVLLTSEIPWSTLGQLWRQMRMLVILILVLQPLLRPEGNVWISLGPLSLTSGGVYNAASLAARALSIAFVTGALLYTTEHWALVLAFVRLGLPYTWGLTISLTLRFLPAIQSLFHAVRDAQAARGWVAEGNVLQRLRDYLPVLVAVMIGTLRISDQLTLALAARGLMTSRPQTRWRDLAMRPPDWWVLAFVTGGFVLLLSWRFGLFPL
jgi:energy-coupling factor transport system permease protein